MASFIWKDTLTEVKKEKFKYLSDKCKETILGRFPAVVDSVTYYFSNDIEAQSNFKDTKMLFDDGTIDLHLGGFVTWTCYDADGNVQRVKLDKANFSNVFITRVKYQNDNVSKLRDVLEPQVDSATTIEEVNSITW